MKNKVAYLFISAFVLVGQGPCNIDERTEVKVIELNFEPINPPSYNLQCNDRDLRYVDVKLFRPIVRLDTPAPTGFTIPFAIMEQGSPSDPTIGLVDVRFDAGATTPSSFSTPNDKATVESRLSTTINRMPDGAPQEETQGFWLGCTKSCVVRGNGPKGNAGQQNVYLDRGQTGFHVPDDPSAMVLGGRNQSAMHPVQCLPSGT